MTHAAAVRTGAPKLPGRLNHAAYTVADAVRTTRFYRDLLGFQLVGFVIDDKVPSTGDAFPYVHLFFQLGDGSTLAFFESVGLPPPAAPSHPAYAVFNHIALDVGTPAEVDAWATHLKAHGIDFIGPVDHGVIYSIYFHDPDGNRLEFTCNTRWQPAVDASEQALEAWRVAKESSAARGGDVQPLMDLIQARRAEHKRTLDAVR